MNVQSKNRNMARQGGLFDEDPLIHDSQSLLEEEPRGLSLHHDDIFIAISPYLIETLGTFFLMLTIGFNVIAGTNLAPLAIGSALMVLVFFGGHLSGAHYNPAVTIGAKLTFRDHIGWLQSLLYVVCQIVGAILAGLTYYGITEQTFRFEPQNNYAAWKAVLVEFIYSFLLVSVMINTATTKSQTGNSFFGLAIGFTVLTGGFTIGGISSAVLNPAVGVGAAVADFLHNDFDLNRFEYLWIYVVGPGAGGILAGIVFRITNAKEFRVRKTEDRVIDHNYKLTHGVVS